MPSPVATAGFVVSRNTWPAPPVASSTARRARHAPRAVVIARSATPRHAPSSTIERRRQRVRRAPRTRRSAAHARPQHAARSRGRSRRPRAARAGRCARLRAPSAGSPSALAIERARPSRSARGRSEGPRATSTSTASGRTGRRRRRACRRGAARASRRGRSPPRCRPARSRCCSRRVRPWSAAGRRPRPTGSASGAQTGDAAADHDEIGLQLHRVLSYHRHPAHPGHQPRTGTAWIAPASTSAPLRATIRSRSDRAARQLGGCSTTSTSRGRAFVVCSPTRLAAPRRGDRARAAAASSRSSSPTASGTRSCRPSSRVYDALVDRTGGPRSRHRRGRRRRHRRHGRLRRGDLPARHPRGARADDAAGAGGQRDRRQGGRQSSRSART